MKKLTVTFCLIPFILSAQRGDRGDKNIMKDPPADLAIPDAPVLSPEEALKSFQVAEGYKLEIFAADPLVHDPVVVKFDAGARAWVCEMRGYMPDVDGKGENEPNGRIVILEDTDGDGRCDKNTVFLDKLVLPRAIAFAHGGLLYCSPPALKWIEILPGDKPGEEIVIDPNYARGGNVEHQANALLRGLDNWFYNAKSDKRFRRIHGEWKIEKDSYRGQWGLGMDSFGRLYANGNSSNIRGDVVMPGQMMRNPAQKKPSGLNAGLAGNKVFPIRVNTGVNRGYKGGTLDANFKLNSFTGASGPMIYRGSYLGDDWAENGLVPEPCGNLVKRNIIEDLDGSLKGRFAYPDSELVASTDERFRPVSLYNTPDGALLIVDMYRGIIQHKTYVTTYLRRQILKRGLDKPLGLGRLYKLVRTDKAPSPSPKLHEMKPPRLVAMLAHPSGWVRDTAQRLLVDAEDQSVVNLLTELCGKSDYPLGQIHALWTLEGLRAVSMSALQAAAKSDHRKVRMMAARLCETQIGTPDEAGARVLLIQLAVDESNDVRIQCAMTLGQFDHDDARATLADLLIREGKSSLIRSAAISGLTGREATFLATYIEQAGDKQNRDVVKLIANAAAGADDKKKNEVKFTGPDKKRYEHGREVYSKICIGCHMDHGEGMAPLGPPLRGSEWVTGSEKRLARLILHGIQGPIKVGGKLYQPPEIQPLMPGLKDSSEFDDRAIADVMSYVRNTWGNQASLVDEKTVTDIRIATKDRQGLYTPEELLKLNE